MTLSCTYQFYLYSLTHLDISAVRTGSAKNFQMMITQIASKPEKQSIKPKGWEKDPAP
jgi:hypothetical protein